MGSIYGAFFTKDGRHLISAGDDKVIRIWNVQEKKTVRTLRGEASPGNHGKILALAVSHDGRWIAAGGIMAPGSGVRDDEVGDIRLYELESGNLVGRLRGHRKAVWALAFSPDDWRLISGSEDGTAIIWDLSTRQRLWLLNHKRGGLEYEVRAVGFSPDGLRAATGDYNKKIRLWKLSDGKQISEQTAGDRIRALAVSSKGVVATGDKDRGEIRLWNSTTGMPIWVRGNQQIFANQGSGIGALSFSPDGAQLLSTCGDSCNSFEQNIWDAASGAKITAYQGHKGVAENTVFAASFSADGKLAVTADSSKSEIHIWDAKNPNNGAIVLGGSGAPVWAVGFSAATDRLAWGHKSEPKSYNDRGPLELQLLFPSTGRSLEHPEKLASDPVVGMVRAIEEVRPYRLAIPGNDDGVLELRRNNQVKLLRRNNAVDGTEHDSFTFSPDGQNIFSGGDNGKVIVYDREGRRQLPDLDGHEGEVWAIALIPPYWCPSRKCDLDYSGADARAFASQFRTLVKDEFNKIECYLLVSEATVDSKSDCAFHGTPTKANIENTIDKVSRNARQEDTVAFFFAGHGMNDKLPAGKQYLFLPTEAQAADADEPHFLATSVVRWDALQNGIKMVNGRRLMFVDTCHASGAFESYSTRMVKDGYDDEIVVFSAVDRERPSQERAELGHGVFTYFVVRGLKGEAASGKEITVFNLGSFVARKVREMTQGQQIPRFYVNGTDFPIGTLP